MQAEIAMEEMEQRPVSFDTDGHEELKHVRGIWSVIYVPKVCGRNLLIRVVSLAIALVQDFLLPFGDVPTETNLFK